MLLPVLYKKTSTGSIQYWSIETQAISGPGPMRAVIGGKLVVKYGQLGTDSPQITSEDILKGKNEGRSNETTAHAQAGLEAKARWEKQVKKGYVESLEEAKAGKTELPGIVPMLAQQYDDHAHKIYWPAIVQPKLDGMRCIAILENGTVQLFSRTRKPITSMKHIEQSLLQTFGNQSLILDGELYNHALKSDFESIISAARKQDYDPETAKLIQYHVYDMLDPTDEDRPAASRQAALDSYPFGEPVCRVQTALASTDNDMRALYDAFIENGYEGAIVRNTEAAYENKRSYNLQKVKEFQDAEFQIIDVKEGRGKMAGHGIFICQMDGGKQFDCKLAGDTGYLKTVLAEKDRFIGKMLTVQYQGFSNKNQVPRFPVGLRIREEE